MASVIVPQRHIHFSSVAPTAVVSPTNPATAQLTLSTSAPIINASPVYFNQAVVVEEQVSDMGFSLPGKGPGMFLEIRASDVDSWEVVSLQVPRR